MLQADILNKFIDRIGGDVLTSSDDNRRKVLAYFDEAIEDVRVAHNWNVLIRTPQTLVAAGSDRLIKPPDYSHMYSTGFFFVNTKNYVSFMTPDEVLRRRILGITSPYLSGAWEEGNYFRFSAVLNEGENCLYAYISNNVYDDDGHLLLDVELVLRRMKEIYSTDLGIAYDQNSYASYLQKMKDLNQPMVNLSVSQGGYPSEAYDLNVNIASQLK